MKLFFYSCDKEAPFTDLYEFLDSGYKKLLISNHKQHIANFETYKDRILDEAIGDTITDKKILVPETAKAIFSEWLKEKYDDDAYELNGVFNAEDFCSIGADQLNNFIREMKVEEEWESVVKTNKSNSKSLGEDMTNNKAKPNNTQDEKSKKKQTPLEMDKLSILFVFVFIVLLFIGVVNFKRQGYEETQNKMKEAEKALLEGRYDDAKESAKKVSDSYAKTMKVAINEVDRRDDSSNGQYDEYQKLHDELLSLKKEADKNIKSEQLTDPQGAVSKAEKMIEIEKKMSEIEGVLEIDKSDQLAKLAKNTLKQVIDKYLQIYGHKQNKHQELREKLKTKVLLQKQLRDYATEGQHQKITDLLGTNYWSN